jgi:ribosome-binding factor A
MDQGRRVRKFESEVQKIVSAQLVGSHLQSQAQALVTVTRVLMPADLKSARIYISVLPWNSEATNKTAVEETVLELLEEYRPRLQGEIAKELKAKFCPKLSFFTDSSVEKVIQVEKLLREVSQVEDKKD